MTQDAPCSGPRPVAIGIEYTDAGVIACDMPGQTPCLVDAVSSCCVYDCSGTDLCLGSTKPSCCIGYCGETFCGDIHEKPGCDAVPNPDCTSSFGPSQAACCSDAGIVVPASIAILPNEWTVSLGEAVMPPAPSDAGALLDSGSLSDGGSASPAATSVGDIPVPHTQCSVTMGVAAGHAGASLCAVAVALVAMGFVRRFARSVRG
jgi:hypothetical protein